MTADGGATAVDVVTRGLDQAFDVRSWHGTNLRGSLRGVSATEALWRPAAGRHCIWEIVLHCAYWKYAVHRRLAGNVQRGTFPRRPSDWPHLPEPADEDAWREDVALLAEFHGRLRAVASTLDGAVLRPEERGWSKAADLVIGVAAHDLYHAGQIQLLKRLQR